MRKIAILSLFVFLTINIFSQSCFNKERYQQSVFDSIVITENITYATVPQLVPTEILGVKTYDEDESEDVSLQMDIYQPYGDTLKKRPMIVFMHSGGFLPDYGDRHNDDMLAFCDTFARKGYVTATISYRLGYDVLDSVAAIRAVYRAVQDGRAAIRFLKEKAAIYKIDTNNIFMLGSSAGAFIALHNLYLNEESERPEETYKNDDHPDLGGLDKVNPDLHHISLAKSVVSLWGALRDTALILKEDIRPTLLVHGIDDESVYFEYDHPFGLSTLPKVYGSHPVYKKLKQLDYDAPHYFVPEQEHEFYGIDGGKWEDDAPNAYWDTILNEVTDFIYEQLPKPKALFAYNLDCGVYFTNNSENQIANCWSFGDSTYSQEQNPYHLYTNDTTFNVNLSVINYIGIVVEQEQEVLFKKCVTSVKELISTETIQLYPNPTSDFLNIKTNKVEKTRVSVFNLLGQRLLVKYLTRAITKIDVSSLDSGVYILVVEGTKKQTLKFVKE